MAKMFVHRVHQPNDWSCFAAVAAMITGDDLEDFVAHVGHDGSAIVENGPFEDGRQGFALCEVIGYLASRGFVMGVSAPVKTNIPRVGWAGIPIRVFVPAWEPAILIVTGARYNHAVFWTGREVIDPNPERLNDVEPRNYDVLEWWPVKRSTTGAGGKHDGISA